jgi:hypothetical protein
VTIGGTSNVVVWATSGEYVTGVISVTGTITSSGGTGVILNATNAGLEIGNVNATNTPYIDFHSTGNATVDYDARILASGGSNSTATGTATLSLIGASVVTPGTFTVNSGAAATAIINGASNAVGNIGSSSTYFNKLFAQATTALYADLAENYRADDNYTPGTVVVFGGSKEITVSDRSHDTRVAGVVSTNPAHLMNSGMGGEHAVTVALTGRVPCWVQGPVAKGDRLVNISAGTAGRLDDDLAQIGCMVGKSLEDITTTQRLLIEVSVGRT